MHQKTNLPLFVALLTLWCFSSLAHAEQRSFNNGWLFHLGEETTGNKFTSKPYGDDWTQVQLPHSWNAYDVQDIPYGYYRGTGVYYKSIEFDSAALEGKQFLRFEGAFSKARVMVNGHEASTHLGGYTAFNVDISPYLLAGQANHIYVLVSNAYDPNIPPLSGDFNMYGGIYRDVYLIQKKESHFDLGHYGSKGIYVRTPEVSEAQAEVVIEARVKNTTNTKRKYRVVHRILNKDFKEMARMEDRIKVDAGEVGVSEADAKLKSNFELWSPDKPILYEVRSQVFEEGILMDEAINPLGFRYFSVSAEGFQLNGKKTKLWGVNRHQDYERLGSALSDALHRRDIRLIKEAGFNFLRIAHYPQDPAIHHACDHQGLIAWEEIPLVNQITATPAFMDNTKNMFKEMVYQHMNHPSIVMWGFMNEVMLRKSPFGEEVDDRLWKRTTQLARELQQISKSIDPARLTTLANHKGEQYNDYGLSDVPDILGWNLYFGWYHDAFGKWGHGWTNKMSATPTDHSSSANMGQVVIRA